MDISTYIMLSEAGEFIYFFNDIILGESSLEDFLLVVGTLVAFIAFILWCCFPVTPKEAITSDLQDLDKNEKLIRCGAPFRIPIDLVPWYNM